MRMMKKGAIALSVLFTVGAFAACGGKVPDTPQTLEIWISSTGYGDEWVADIVDLFKEEAWVKEKYPELLTDITVQRLRLSWARRRPIITPIIVATRSITTLWQSASPNRN